MFPTGVFYLVVCTPLVCCKIMVLLGMDETGVLEYGQTFIQIIDPRTQEQVVITGKVRDSSAQNSLILLR